MGQPVCFSSPFDGAAATDEVQRVPELALAIKASVDRDRRPGRFILTGSSNVMTVPILPDSLAGRVEVVYLNPLSQGELAGVRETFVEARFSPSFPVATHSTALTRSDLVRRVLTGGAHCSVLYSDGRVVARSSDVGRHNTVDKVIGHAVLSGIDPARCVLGCTGRQPAGMVRKARNAGIPVIVTKAATTAEGIALAREAGITLICRVKEGAFRVYSHPWRVEGLADDAPVGGTPA